MRVGVFWMPEEVGGYIIADSPRLERARWLEVFKLEKDPTENRESAMFVSYYGWNGK
jgi:hypothetical protein